MEYSRVWKGHLKFLVIIYCLLWKKLHVSVDIYSSFFLKNMSFEILSQFIFSLVPLVKILLTFAVYGLY